MIIECNNCKRTSHMTMSEFKKTVKIIQGSNGQRKGAIKCPNCGGYIFIVPTGLEGGK